MSTQTVTTPVATRDWSPIIGRCFLNPWLDYSLIGAALSLPFLFWVILDPSMTPTDLRTKTLVYLFLNYTHFASSTIRLYTKPGEIPHRRLVSYGLPVVAILVTTLCIAFPKVLGDHLWALFFSWSPYHYAMQAYGLALMYCYRSGVFMDKTEKWMFWGIAMLPFVRALLVSDAGGLTWIQDTFGISHVPYVNEAAHVLAILIFALPIIVFFRLRDKGKTLPLIAWVLLFVNGIWWVTVSYGTAWIWATIFHSIQYIVIVVIFHVNDQMKNSENKKTPVYHACWFYTASFLLGYLLFQVWPFMYMPFGFEMEAAVLMTVATINLHHFIVDGFIWRSAKKKKVAAV